MTEDSQSIAAVSPTSFFTLTYILSWLVWVPLLLSHFGVGPFHIPEQTANIVRLLGVLMPAVSSVILSLRAGGCGAIRNLGARLLRWRVGWRWWFAAIAGQPALLVLAALISNLISDSKVRPSPHLSPSALIINIIILLIATLGEEVGWRGLALPALQARYSAFFSSLIIAILWATWHVPFWLLLDTFDQFGAAYLGLNYLLALPLTFYITWIFNHCDQSVLLPVMIHITFNIVNSLLLPVTLNVDAFLLFVGLLWIYTFFILPHLDAKGSG